MNRLWYVFMAHEFGLSLRALYHVLLFNLIVFCTVQIAYGDIARQKAAIKTSEIIQKIIETRRLLKSVYVEYDLIVLEGGRRDHKLSVTEAISQSHSYSRVVHWYDQSLYRFKKSKYDPFLNTYYWSQKGKYRVQDITRKVLIAPGMTKYIASPSIERYCGYIGLLTPERRLDGDINSDVNLRYTAKEYYLPEAFLQSGWQIDNKSKRDSYITLIRETEHVIDQIIVDVALNYSVRNRQIFYKATDKTMHIVGSEFVEYTSGVWLPTKLTVSSTPEQTMYFQVKKLTAVIPEECLKPNFLNGSIIQDESGGIISILPGGEDLLNFTIDRMRLAMPNSDPIQVSWIQKYLVKWQLILGALIFMLVMTLSFTRQMLTKK